ncbi:fractalkine isoform X2 [Alligator mississippiensis]|uniref:fractalkine isoform X2 n=1 Tax=Alligator mississippiensis TaxID=8496 RepID=UPI00090706E5|nr:fractalkine isoform X2 [Alligator mississippiensis]
MYVTLFALGQPKSFVGCATMCKGFTKELPLRLLKSYKKTDPSCPKSVIIFSTKKSREFCANPEESWVKVRVTELDRKNAPPTPSPSNPISSVLLQEKAGVFQRVIGGAVSTATQTSGSVSPSYMAGTTLSEATDVSAVRAEGTNIATLVVQESMWLSTKPSSVIPGTNTATYSEPATYGNEVSMRLITHPAAHASDTNLSGLTPYATSPVRRPESFVGSTQEATGSSTSGKADVPTTEPYRFNSYTTPVMKNFESYIESTWDPTESSTTRKAIALSTITNRINSHPTLVMTRSQSYIGSTEESTGPPTSTKADASGPVPSRFNSDPTWVMKGFDKSMGSTNRSTGDIISPVADKSDADPRRFTSNAPSIESSPESAIFQTTLALIKSVPSKPAEEFTLMRRVMESYTMKTEDVVKESVAVTGLTTHSSSVEGETSSFSKNRDNARQVGRDSASRGEANTSNHSYPVEKEDSPQSIPESISPADTSVFISTTSLEMNRARMTTEIPAIPFVSSRSFLAQYQILSTALLSWQLFFV